MLAPLLATCFELSDWKAATVQFNYHISVDRMLYLVLYEHIKKKVDVKVTDTTIEIFYNHNRIASHRRLKGRPGQYSTVTKHMLEDHQKYLEWNGDWFCKWAELIDQVAVKLTSPVPLILRLVSSISIPGMSVSLICLLIWIRHGQIITRVNSHDYTGDFHFRTSDLQISRSAISSHKNIQLFALYCERLAKIIVLISAKIQGNFIDYYTNNCYTVFSTCKEV